MESDVRNILDAMLVMSRQINDRIAKFTRYLVLIVILTVLCFSIMTSIVVISNNRCVTEMTRLYFETDYSYPETDITQTQTIGDVK